MREDAQKILDEARAKLRELDGIESVFEADAYVRDYTFEPLVRDVRPTAPRAQEEEQMTQDFSGWEMWLSAHLANFGEMIGAEIGKSDRAINRRLEALEQKVGELSAESHVRSNAEVIDLPNWRKNAAG